jgi:hypothetical protein
MGRKDQRAEEDEIMTHVSSVFPTFLDGISFVAASTDPPDFLGQCESGRRIGLELTSWLDGNQVSAARTRERMRRDLLRIVEWEKHPRPRNFCSVVIMPRWNEKIRKDHYQDFCKDFHAATQDVDKAWKTLRDGHWRTLRPEERFDYEMHQSDINRYPALTNHISSIWFTEPRQSSLIFPEESWISIEQDGGLYDPTWAVQALRKAVESKVDHYREKDMKAHLDGHNLHKLYLLVHTDPARFSDNTPYQTCSQMMISPVEGLTEAARRATESLSTLPRVFDGIFLLYHVWNARWLAQIWPTVQHVPAIDLLRNATAAFGRFAGSDLA